MPTLNEAKQLISDLATRKGWGTDVGTKIFYAMIELGEAGDVWKHRADPEYLKEIGIVGHDQIIGAIAEEIIDTIFYCLHALECLDNSLNVDELYMLKFKTNKGRNRIYADDETRR